MQPDQFGASGGQPNLWADVDGDHDLDLVVGFRGRPNRLYKQTAGTFRDVAAIVGLADADETRAAAWGDCDSDGDPDLYRDWLYLNRSESNSMRFEEALTRVPGVDTQSHRAQPLRVATSAGGYEATSAKQQPGSRGIPIQNYADHPDTMRGLAKIHQ